jgi:signal-transduction protein with cAMP-binding, CBS, and nucleotidyltransferase domain
MNYLHKTSIYSIDYLNVIEECLSSMPQYSTVLRDKLFESTKLLKFPKGSYIIKEGQYLKGGFSVISGCVKEYYYFNNEQKITQFFTEDDIMPIVAIEAEVKVGYYWECMEDTIVTFETIPNRQKIFTEFPFLMSMSFQYMQQSFMDYRQAMHQYVLSSPKERYLNLIEKKPELVNRLPQYEIANFIGIKAESLSRIRRRLYDFERN